MSYVKIKTASIILLLTLLSTFVTMPIAYASEKWNGETASSFAGGSGTQADPYLISNGEQLMCLAALVDEGTSYTDKKNKTKNKYYKLTNDIDFDNKPISTIERFSGYLNGGNHTIRNIAMYLYFEGNSYSGTSLIEFNYGEIRNLNIENIKVTGNKFSSVGGLCLYNYGTIEFCKFKGTVSFGDLTYYPGDVGGLCAQNSENGVIRYCSADWKGVGATKNGISYFGGIAAQNEGTITQCEIRGDVTINTTHAHAIGGCVGYSTGSVSDIYSKLDLFVETSYIKNLYVGGIVGYAPSGIIERCGVRGGYINIDQEAPEGYVNCGGIAGHLKGAVKNCYFIGSMDINLYTNTSASHGIGGIAGYMDYSTISNSYAMGTINRMGDSNQTRNYAAGIAGYAPAKGTINNCFADMSIANNGVGTTGVIAGRENTYMVVNNGYYGTDNHFIGNKVVYSGTGVNTSRFKDKSFLTNTVGLKSYDASGDADAVWLYGDESGYVYPEVYSVCNAIVSYDANGGTNAPSSQKLQYLTTDALTYDIPTRRGYVFKCWSYSPNSTSYTFKAGDKADAFFLNGHITLYAVWEKGSTLEISSVKYENGIFTASVDTIDVKEKSDVYFAVYDKNGGLKTVARRPVDVGDSSFDISTQERLDGVEYDIKLMLWNKNMAPDGKPYELHRTKSDVILESAHNYQNSTDETLVYNYVGVCKSIDVTFSSNTEVEKNYDFIYIYDAYDNEIGKYTGVELSGRTINVPGNTVKIKLTSDGSATRYGYRTESIVVNR